MDAIPPRPDLRANAVCPLDASQHKPRLYAYGGFVVLLMTSLFALNGSELIGGIVAMIARG